jgi:hypothetical protein
MKRLRILLLLLTTGLAAFVGTAGAATPQTIIVDGVNDFDPSNLLDDDRGDTEIKDWCTDDAANDSTMDIGRVYVTNDANFLYLGWEYFEDCFGGVQLGVAIDVDTPAGGIDDPFTRKIGWSTLAKKPDSYLYLEQFPGFYQIYYRWTGTAWADSSALVAGSPSGSNALGAVVNTRFVEMKIPFAALRAGIGTTINLEFWMTQNGANKGPLDAMCGDAVQMSRGGTTTFDTAAVVQMPCMTPYTILNAVDNTPPIVNGANAVGFPLLADKSFSGSTNRIDVVFSEPVQNPSAQTAANYVLTGPSAPSVVVAQRDAVNSSIVHLTLSSTIGAAAGFYNVTVQNVRDLANNVIVNNGNTNVGSFFIQALAFQVDVRLRLCKGEFATTDSFAIEGNLAPLTFATVGDNARLYDANSDSVYTGTVPFSMMKDRTTGKAEADLLWKASRKAPSGSFYEPGSDRAFHLTSDSAAVRTLAVSWGNDQSGDFTPSFFDVFFEVDLAPIVRGGQPHKAWLVGSEAPLSFVRPGLLMKDDGVFPDEVANDTIFTLKVRFPPCTPKNVNWKVVYDSTATDTVYECPGQGDRNVFLNSALYDTVGGANGALRLAPRAINRCTVTDKAVCVVFRVLTSIHGGPPAPADTVAVIGNRPPLSADRPPSAEGIMRDNGVAPDAVAGDHLFTRAITFPDSTPFNVTFKYWWNQWTNFGFECEGFGDRSFNLDDVNHSATVCQIRNIDIFNRCEDVTAVFGPRPAGVVADFAVLRQSFPNPSSPRSTIQFELKRAAHVTLTVYDVGGRRVATLVDGPLTAGPHAVTWNGRDAGGARVRAGLYVYELASGGQSLSRRLVVTR